MLAKLLARALESTGFWNHVDLAKISSRLDHAKDRQLQARVTSANSSRFYATAEVVNMTGEASRVRLGANTHIRGELLVFSYGGEIELGEYCYLGKNSSIWSGDRVTIGNHVLISQNCCVADTNSHELDALARARGYENMLRSGHPKTKGSIDTSPITIEDHVWISFNCCVLKGVTIGEGAVVGAGSVVTEDVPASTLVAGVPARPIRRLG